MTTYKHSRGFTLLFSVIVSSVLLAVTLTLVNLTTKQFKLSGIARESEAAFNAANMGIECIRYNDVSNSGGVYNIASDGSTDVADDMTHCETGVAVTANTSPVGSGTEQSYTFDWIGSCVDLSIWKFSSDSADVLIDYGQESPSRMCPRDTVCTVIKSRGYNRSCADLSKAGTIERELTFVY